MSVCAPWWVWWEGKRLLTLVYPPSLPWQVYTPGIYHTLPHPGYTHHPGYTVSGSQHRSACPGLEPWAQTGRKPWVGGLCAEVSPKRVKKEGGLRAELLRSSREKNTGDRIATG